MRVVASTASRIQVVRPLLLAAAQRTADVPPQRGERVIKVLGEGGRHHRLVGALQVLLIYGIVDRAWA